MMSVKINRYSQASLITPFTNPSAPAIAWNGKNGGGEINTQGANPEVFHRSHIEARGGIRVDLGLF